MSEPKYDSMLEDVLTHMQKNPGKRYGLSQLARNFKTTNANVKVMIATLGIRVDAIVIGKNRLYYVKTGAEREQEERMREARNLAPVATHAKPYVQPQSMTAALERCRELYPNGANFKSVS